jgi:methionine biosynthesis protein MetW
MHLPAQPGGKLLEVGCGSGEMLKVMQELGWGAEGIDFDQKAVENAQGKGLRVVHGTLEAQEYPNDHFDAVTMSHLIEHVQEPGQLLAECHRILKPAGRLVIATPNAESWGHRLFASSWFPLEPPRHLHVFNHSSLTLLAQKSGFRIVKLFTTINNASTIFISSRAIRSTGRDNPQPWRIRRWGKAMMLMEWGILHVSPYVGEELVVVLEKESG